MGNISISVVIAALLFLQACSPADQSALNQINVAQAFETSNALPVKPYTRTIFSTNDF